MTKDRANIVRLSIRDWAGIITVVVSIIITIFIAGLTIERRLTEVLTRQEQLEVRIERIENQIDRGGSQWPASISP